MTEQFDLTHPYEAGAKVVLISGGPVMTVADLHNYLPIVRCIWFDEQDRAYEGEFPIATLRPEPRVMG